LEHDDRNRVLIGTNILRQSLPTLNASSPRVTSKLGLFVRKDRGPGLYARWPGIVCYVSAQRILVQSQLPFGTVVRHHQLNELDSIPKTNEKFGFSFTSFKNQSYNCCVEYRVGGISRSNQGTWRWQSPCVYEGMWVRAGDVMGDRRTSLYGHLVIGQNLLLGYIAWDGINFEDAIVASESLVKSDLFTSNHIEEWETSLQRTIVGIESFVPFSSSLLHYIKEKEVELWKEFARHSIEKYSTEKYNRTKSQVFLKKKSDVYKKKAKNKSIDSKKTKLDRF